MIRSCKSLSARPLMSEMTKLVYKCLYLSLIYSQLSLRTSRKWCHTLTECHPPLQIYLQQKLVLSCQNWLTTPPSLPRTPVHPSQPPAAETKANLTQSLEVGGRGIHEVGRWGSVMEEIPCLIFTGLPNWTLLKDELCSWPTFLREGLKTPLTDAQSPAGICRCG